MEGYNFELIDFGDFLPMVADISYLIYPLIPVGYVTLVAARGGVGKSAYALYISNELVGKGKKVLYLDGESCASIFKKRCLEWNLKNWKKIKTIVLKPQNNACAHETYCPSKIEDIRAAVELYKPDLLVIDSLTSLAQTFNLNDKQEVSKVFKKLMDIAFDFGAAILLLAHTKKKQNPDELITLDSIAGSGTITDFSKSVILIENEFGSEIRTVTQVKLNIDKCAEPFTFNLGKDGVTDIGKIPLEGDPEYNKCPEIRSKETKIGKIKRQALELLRQDLPRKDIRRILRVEHSAFDAEIQTALDWASRELGIVWK